MRGGSIDILWINGENFRSARTGQRALGPVCARSAEH
jgi:ABC-type uncharacterized transport system YnjBCD substrate-binding protein